MFSIKKIFQSIQKKISDKPILVLADFSQLFLLPSLHKFHKRLETVQFYPDCMTLRYLKLLQMVWRSSERDEYG